LRKKCLNIIVTNCPSCSQFHQHFESNFFLSISFCNEHTNLIKEYRKAVKKISFLFLPHCVINVDKASYTYSQCKISIKGVELLSSKFKRSTQKLSFTCILTEHDLSVKVDIHVPVLILAMLTFSQFHQHYTCAFFVRTSYRQLFYVRITYM